MWYKVMLFLTAIFLSFSVAAKGRQASAAPASPQMGSPISPTSSRDCSKDNDTLRDAKPAAEWEQRVPQSKLEPAGPSETADADISPVNLEQDLKFLGQRQSELAECMLPATPPGPAQDLQGACFGELLLNFEMRHDGEQERDVPIGRLAGNSAFFYESGMTIDADGAPNAYHPDNTGLDDLANAGTPGRWEGLAKDAEGEPIIQGPNDPFPGYYVSATALADRSKPANDPARYVDASKIPFVVLPGGMARQLGARPGDFAAVFNQRNGKSTYAIFGDVGPGDRIGEGSMALADNLGIRSDARNGGARRGILYLVFPGSGNGRPRTNEEINAEGQKLLQAWEASISRDVCTARQPAQASDGIRSIN